MEESVFSALIQRINLSSIYLPAGKMTFIWSSSTLLKIDIEKANQATPSAAAEGVAGNEIWVDS